MAGGKLATDYLYEQGCRKIAIVAGVSDTISPTENRRLGYQTMIAERHLTPLIHYLPRESNLNQKRQSIHQFLVEQQPDGVFCTDDLTAVIVQNLATTVHLDNLKVVGYDGTQVIQSFMPSLSTIVQPIDDLAELMVKILIQKIEDEQFTPQANYVLPVTLKK